MRPTNFGPRLGKWVRIRLLTLAVWYLYKPYLGLMRAVGPRCGVRLARLCAWGHWVLTLFGVQRQTRLAIARTHPFLHSTDSVRTIHRKYLENKYQHFVEWHLAATPRGRKFIEDTYYQAQGEDIARTLLMEKRGAIILGFHFGMMKLIRTWFFRCHNVDAFELVFRSATYMQDTTLAVARMALATSVHTDRASGLRNIYLHPDKPPLAAIKRLKQGWIVGLAGDGMVAGDFIEVPFLGGTMRFPTGFARLAAITQAPVVPVFGILEGLERHRIVVHPPIYCHDNSAESIEAAVRQGVQLLEDYVRRYPWAWWIWHRLEFEDASDRGTRITARAPKPQEREVFYESVGE